MKSIGDMLRRARERRRLSIEVVSKTTKIHPRYLQALESDNYSIFEGKVHSKGFLKIYAGFLNLDVNEVLALWRREYEKDLEDKDTKVFPRKERFGTPKFNINTANLTLVVSILLVFLFFGYLYHQYKSFTGNPLLEVYHPADNAVLTSDVLDITGKTDLDSKLTINNQEVILNPDGTFTVSVKLREGLNTLGIRSENKLNKKTEIFKTVIYRPIKPAELVEIPQTSESTQSSLSLPN